MKLLILGKKYLPIENRYLGEVQKTDNATKGLQQLVNSKYESESLKTIRVFN